MRFFVASDNTEVSARIQEVLRRNEQPCQVVALNPADQAGERLMASDADALAVVLSPNPEPALAFLHKPRPNSVLRVFAIGPVSEAAWRLGALRDGADQYLDECELESELDVVLRRLSAQTHSRYVGGKLIALLAPSGGSGSSTLAINLATALAKEHRNCALVDLNLGAGDLAPLLDLKPNHTLADLCSHSTRMDRAIFERSLERHPSGVALLAPSRSFAEIRKVGAQGVRDAVYMARVLFPYVVVDLDDAFHGEQVQTLKQADAILLVLRLDFTSLRNTRKVLEHLTELGIARAKVQLVVNRYGQPQELPASKAEEVLSAKVAFYIPDDPKTINRANNNGIPAVIEAPTSKVSKTILQIAQTMSARMKAAG